MVPRHSMREAFGRHPIARETVVAFAGVWAFALWIDLVTDAVFRYVPTGAVDASGGPHAELALSALLTSGFLIAGMVAFAAGFARLRDLGPAVGLPTRQTLVAGCWATATGVALVGVVQLVATLTGGSLAPLAGVAYAPNARGGLAALVTVLGLFVGVPAYVIPAHLVVQRSGQRTGRPLVAVGLTVLVVGVVGPTGLLNVRPLRMTAATGLLVLAIALPVVAAETVDRDWVTALALLPLAVFLAGLVFERTASVEGATSVAYHGAELAAVAVGAYAYERSNSLLPSALAYTAFVVATRAVVFVADAGVPV
ncbi:hypothetical protein VB773_03280 [Haloarculaceae archaeon H-GB2-1]|nr:hypothetical protein [Haloarculaceae archaeon H-GB1-1]MEA5406699.1 hypothetical protein [Haloarculaceae archaeon H-GB2-1]